MTGRGRREPSSIYWFTSQIPITAKAGPGKTLWIARTLSIWCMDGRNPRTWAFIPSLTRASAADETGKSIQRLEWHCLCHMECRHPKHRSNPMCHNAHPS